MKGVYLLHFDTPYHHAQHYVGYSDDIARRYIEHCTGRGAALTNAAREAGVTFRIVRTWVGKGYTFERKLHNYRHNRIICPVCNPGTAELYPTPRRYAPKYDNVEVPF